MRRRVLVIEDDPSIARLVKLHLADLDCQVEVENDGRSGLERYRKAAFDLVVLDLMLPSLDGLSICRAIRQNEGYTPILMLTAKSGEQDRVHGLETGADDYLTKPFSVPELVARAKALFRRAEALSRNGSAPEKDEIIERGALLIDVGRRAVTVDGTPVVLTAKEFDLLLHFARHPGMVFNRSALLDRVWGHHHEGYEHTVNSHINRLRGKIEPDPAKPRYVLTVWGVGYKLNES